MVGERGTLTSPRYTSDGVGKKKGTRFAKQKTLLLGWDGHGNDDLEVRFGARCAKSEGQRAAERAAGTTLTHPTPPYPYSQQVGLGRRGTLLARNQHLENYPIFLVFGAATDRQGLVWPGLGWGAGAGKTGLVRHFQVGVPRKLLGAK